jgi:ATP-dependent DNA helicase RecG
MPRSRRIHGKAVATLLSDVRKGEDGTRQFKRDVQHADSLAAELVAFANANGGTILIGVADDGTMPGLSFHDVQRVNQLIANVASHSVRSPITVHTRNVTLANGRLVVELKVPRGLDKPYFDRSGVIWLKAGADKRRINSKEELRRLFQMSGQFHADALPTPAGSSELDMPRLRDFLRTTFGRGVPKGKAALLRLLRNMNLATDNGTLNLAGLLLFAEQPERHRPQLIVKAVRYPGDAIHASMYGDSEDFCGPLPRVFDGALAFVLRNLHKVQAGRGVNTPGVPEIPGAVFEELLVNALVHRDYLVSAPIRLFVFRDRIEIISPGHLPNSLTVENIRSGNSNIRNPILASYVAKGLLPYRGLGSGVPRALGAWPSIEFRDDRDGTLFTATVRRAPMQAMPTVGITHPSSEIGSEKSSEKVLALLATRATTSAREVAEALKLTPRAVEKQIAVLKSAGRLRRLGSPKGGRWEVLGP